MSMSGSKEVEPADLYAAHVFARLIQGGNVSPRECSAIMEDRCRDAAVAMFAVNADQRAQVLWTRLGEEADWWLDLANTVDPAAQAPEDGAWQSPTAAPAKPAKPLPLKVLPARLADYVWQVSQVMCAAIDYPACAAIGVAAGALGRSAIIQLKPSWREPASLFLALVGDPGSAKSPAIDHVCAPAWRVQAEALAAHKIVLDEFKSAKKARAAAAKAGRPSDGDDGDDPPPPERFLVSDYTIEALVAVLRDNPRGVLVIRDELMALFAGMNQYRAGGKGNDRQFYLSAWSGGSVVVDRKTQADGVPAFVAQPCLTILGGATPGMLSEMREGRNREDGMIDRFLFCVPDRVGICWNDWVVDPAVIDDWSDAIRRLRSRAFPMGEDGRGESSVAPLAANARDPWIDWHDRHCAEADADDFPPGLRGAWSKMRAYTARFALVLEFLAWAYDPTASLEQSRLISRASMEGGIALAEYFKSHALHARSLLGGSQTDQLSENARVILHWSRGRVQFSRRDVDQSMRKRWIHGGLDESLAELVAAGCLALVPQQPTGGRPRSPVYRVNPLSEQPIGMGGDV